MKFAIRQSPPVSLAQQKAWGLGQEQEQEQRRQVSVVRLGCKFLACRVF